MDVFYREIQRRGSHFLALDHRIFVPAEAKGGWIINAFAVRVYLRQYFEIPCWDLPRQSILATAAVAVVALAMTTVQRTRCSK